MAGDAVAVTALSSKIGQCVHHGGCYHCGAGATTDVWGDDPRVRNLGNGFLDHAALARHAETMLEHHRDAEDRAHRVHNSTARQIVAGATDLIGDNADTTASIRVEPIENAKSGAHHFGANSVTRKDQNAAGLAWFDRCCCHGLGVLSG